MFTPLGIAAQKARFYGNSEELKRKDSNFPGISYPLSVNS